jgi:MtN3 and saliva related transmembrane protein
MEIFTDIIGYLAAVVGTVLMLPQVYKSYKSKKVDDISMVMVVTYLVNCALWEVYGLLIDAKPVILCNFIALFIAIFQLYLKIKFTDKKNPDKMYQDSFNSEK